MKLTINPTGAYIVAYASLLHVIWALALFTTDIDTWATPIAPYFKLFGGSHAVGAWLTIVSILAVAAKCVKDVRWTLALLIPQQLLLMISAWASIFAIAVSAYADGVIRPRVFIFCDQMPNVLAMLCHSAYVCVLSYDACCKWCSKR